MNSQALKALRSLLMSKRINEGDMLPPFFGIAYWDYVSDTGVCYVVPLNLIVRFLRNIWIFVRTGGYSIRMNPRDAFYQGIRHH